jgi:hypothetical protein
MNDRNISIQEYLTIGYVYLIILGMLRDAIFYTYVDVNIISYSNILDILLSPFAYIASSPMVVVALVVLIIVLIYMATGFKKFHMKFRDRTWYKKLNNVEKLDEKYNQEHSIDGVLMSIGLIVFCFFIGTGFGQGYKTSKNIAENNIKPNHIITMKSGLGKEVQILGTNSTFIFYLEPGDKHVTIVPFADNITSIQKLENKETKDTSENPKENN